MDFNIFLNKDAKTDLFKIIEWYENKQTGLGENFLVEFENLLNLLELNPKAFVKIYKNFR